jgi:hypothetical protein
MTFIEEELFYDNRRNLIVYEKLSIDFNLNGVVMTFIDWELFHDKRSKLNVF